MNRYKWIATVLILMVCHIFYAGSVIAKGAGECFVCGNAIKGEHYIIGKHREKVHKSCFVCKKCKKNISKGFNQDGGDLYHPDCYKELKGIVCGHCGKVLKDQWFEEGGAKFHEKCYRDNIQTRCGICRKLIHDNYKKDDEGSYHPDCFKNHKLDKCVICSLPIESGGVIDVWGNNSHSEHKGAKPGLCGSCGRVISKKTSDGGFVLRDERIVCGICDKTAVINQTMVETFSVEIRALLVTAGVTIPDNVPVNLVDTNQLSVVAADIYTDKTRGFTNSISRTLGRKRISITHNVYALLNMPAAEFKGVLIHEYLHVWLNERGIKMTMPETEGFCNLGVMMANSFSDEPLSEVLQKNLDNNPDPVYGDGYREMKARLDRMGWKSLIQYVTKYQLVD